MRSLDVPEETDKSDKFHKNAGDGPFEKHHEAADQHEIHEAATRVAFGGVERIGKMRRRRIASGRTYMPPKKHNVPLHFSRLEKK
jgi:hypothetical protein